MKKLPTSLQRAARADGTPRPARLRTVDLMTGLLVLGVCGTIGAGTMTAHLQSRPIAAPSADVADAVAVLRQTFGYDGVAQELNSLRQGEVKEASQAIVRSLRAARGAIGLLRRELPDDSRKVGRALDQLESAARRLETILRADQASPEVTIIDLPVLEPLFVLDRALQELQEAIGQRDAGDVQAMLWLTIASASLLAAAAILLAAWTRLAVLAPLRSLASGLNREGYKAAEAFRRRSDDFGTVARSLLAAQPTAAAIPDAGLRAMLQDHAGLLERTRDLLETIAHRSTNEPEPMAVDPLQSVLESPQLAAAPATPLVILPDDPRLSIASIMSFTNEPEPAAPSPAPPLVLTSLDPKPPADRPSHGTNEPKPARSEMLHSIVEMVAKEQLRRHKGDQAAPDAAGGPDDVTMAVLVDRVLARLDQVTERVTLKAVSPEARRAS